MSFFVSALPKIFANPLFQQALGSVAGGLWSMIKSNAKTAANDFVNNTVQQSVRAVEQRIAPVKNSRVYPFDEPDDEQDQWEDEDRRIMSRPPRRVNINNPRKRRR